MAITTERLPPVIVNYLIAELELLSLCVDISQLKQLLPKVEFDYAVDHLGLTYIMKSETDPASVRIK